MIIFARILYVYECEKSMNIQSKVKYRDDG